MSLHTNKTPAAPPMQKRTIIVNTVITSAIILALGFFALTGSRASGGHGGHHRARGMLATLSQAIEGYFDECGRLPLAGRPQPVRTDGSGLMNVLLAIDVTANPKEIAFYSTTNLKARNGRNGIILPGPGRPHAELRDPWGNPCFVAMDTDGDGRVTDPLDPAIILENRRALAWSAGPDGRHDLSNPKAGVNKDNVYSWKQ